MCAIAARPVGDPAMPAEGRLESPRVDAIAGVQCLALPDGLVLVARAIAPGDSRALQRLYGRLSPRTVYFRFLAVVPVLTDERARSFADADGVDRVALVVQDPVQPAELIAVARYHRDAERAARAEFAVVVEDRWQSRRIGPLLLRRLIDGARDGGVDQLYGSAAAENGRILHVLRRLGLPLRVTRDGYLTHVDIHLAAAAQAVHRPTGVSAMCADRGRP